MQFFLALFSKYLGNSIVWHCNKGIPSLCMCMCACVRTNVHGTILFHGVSCRHSEVGRD